MSKHDEMKMSKQSSQGSLDFDSSMRDTNRTKMDYNRQDQNHNIRQSKTLPTVHYINPTDEACKSLDLHHTNRAILEPPYLQDTTSRSQTQSNDEASIRNFHLNARALVGLENLGNTCYMNAVIQCLVHNKSLARYFLATTEKASNSLNCNDEGMKGVLTCQFGNLCSEIYGQEPFSVVCPSELQHFISNAAPDFDEFEQQDAHEWLRIFLDRLMEDSCLATPSPNSPLLSDKQMQQMSVVQQGEYWYNRHEQSNLSIVTDEYCGQFRSTVTCSACGYSSYCFDPFYDISVPVPALTRRLGSTLKRRRSSSDADTSLLDCLSSLMCPETFQSCTTCERCNGRHECTKLLTIEKAPKNLLIHLKRFDNNRRKKNTKVSFPQSDLLDVSPFMSSGAKESSNSRYKLYAICDHDGSAKNGHYSATCLDGSSGMWYCYDDSMVSQIAAKEASFSPSSSSYLLFYRMCDTGL